MLRIAVISLVLVNLLLLGFQSTRQNTQEVVDNVRPPAQDSNIPTIYLFNEINQDQGLMADNRRCFSLGPFHSADRLEETRVSLQSVSSTLSTRQTQALVEKGYWVFLPSFESFQMAHDALSILNARGLDDVAIIHTREWENAVSLGYFLRHKNALKRERWVVEQGFEPQVRVRRRVEPRYWLDYEQIPGAGRVALDMQDRPNDFLHRSLPCPELRSDELETVTDLAAPEPVNQSDEATEPEESDGTVNEGIPAQDETSPDEQRADEGQAAFESTEVEGGDGVLNDTDDQADPGAGPEPEDDDGSGQVSV
jgi:hypothetical protein